MIQWMTVGHVQSKKQQKNNSKKLLSNNSKAKNILKGKETEYIKEEIWKKIELKGRELIGILPGKKWINKKWKHTGYIEFTV